MHKCKHVIIGAGPAALAAAKAIRAHDDQARITLVTREKTLPYSPVVLPYLINGELRTDDLFAKGQAFLEKTGIELLCDKDVAALSPQTSEVVCANGEKIPYDKLLIATGARPQVPKIEGNIDDFLTFRTYADFERLAERLDGKRHVAIFGAGLVATEVAEKLALAGHKVTIIARSSLLRKYFTPQNVARIVDSFKRHGVTVLTKTMLLAADRESGRVKLRLSTGDELVVDELLVATGVAANTFETPELSLVGGCLHVDQCMQTSLPNVYAAGDVAASAAFLDADQTASCQILPEAINQGTVAGANMSGAAQDYKGWISCNTLRCFENTFFSIGETDEAAKPGRSAVECASDTGYLRLVFEEKRLVGAEGLNENRIHPGILLYLIRERVAVADHKDLLASKPKETAAWLMLQHRQSQAV